MTAAFPIWQSRISPLFDTAHRLLIVGFSENGELSKSEVPVETLSPVNKIKTLSDMNVDLLICNAISRATQGTAERMGIRVYPWNAGPVEDIVQSLVELKRPDPKFSIPACGGGGFGRCRGRGRRRGGMWKDGQSN